MGAQSSTEAQFRSVLKGPEKGGYGEGFGMCQMGSLSL